MSKKYVLIFGLLILTGCTSFEGVDADITIEDSYKTIVLEGCEYIYVSRRPFSSEMMMAHKGNCKNIIHNCQ